MRSIAVVGELDADGTFRTMLGPSDADRASPVNIDATGATLSSFHDDELEGDPSYVIATTRDGTPWLVSSHSSWRWQ
jgi:hypothetical protein